MTQGSEGPALLLDANVLYKVSLLDLLLRLSAELGLRLRWTARIDVEWTRNMVAAKGESAAAKVMQRRDAVRRFVADWEVPEPDWAAIEPTRDGRSHSGRRSHPELQPRRLPACIPR
jgi:hypothetical protein